MNATIVPVTDRRTLKEFIRFPTRLYESSPWYVPYLEMERKQFFSPKKNPFFAHAAAQLFLAKTSSGEVVGRVSAHVDHNYIRFHGEETGFFGFFDSIDDSSVASALLGAAEKFLRNQGMASVLGPMNFSTNDEVGILVNGFDGLPFIMMTYNAPYYDSLVLGAGYRKAKDLYAYYLPNDGVMPPFIDRTSGRARRSGRVTLRTLRMNDFSSELELVKEIYNSAWEKNWGFVPMTSDEIDYLAANLKSLVDPALVYFAFVDEEPAGFFMALPDYNQVLKGMRGKLFPFGLVKFLLGRRKIDRIRVLTLGVRKEFRNLGIEALFLEEIHRTGHRRGIRAAELSWILEDNEAMNRILRRLTPEPYRTYRLYGKPL